MDNNLTPLDSVFHALADPTRRAVIQQLGREPAAVSSLAEPFNMALPSFMKHIRVLEDSGLIESRKVGRVRMCSLKPESLSTAERWFAEQRSIWDSRFQQLDTLLSTLKGKEP